MRRQKKQGLGREAAKSNALPSRQLKTSHLALALEEDTSFLAHILSYSDYTIGFSWDLSTSWPSHCDYIDLIEMMGKLHFHLTDFSSLVSAWHFLQHCPLSSTSCLYLRKFPMLSSCFWGASGKHEPGGLNTGEQLTLVAGNFCVCLPASYIFLLWFMSINCFKGVKAFCFWSEQHAWNNVKVPIFLRWQPETVIGRI